MTEWTYDRFLDVIHVEDRERVEAGCAAGARIRPETLERIPNYPPRREHPLDLLSRGRPSFKPSGEPDRLMGTSIDITERKRMEERLQFSLHEILELKTQLERGKCLFEGGVQTPARAFSDIGPEQGPSRRCSSKSSRWLQRTPHVLITGETGTGKELVAGAIHDQSKRKDRILVKVNCATLPFLPDRE